jgi:hypothetical protein
MERLNTISINGTVGKTCTAKYISHILTKAYNVKCMRVELSSLNSIKRIFINEEDIEFGDIKSLQYSNHNDYDIIRHLYLEYLVDVIIISSSHLDKSLDIVVSVVTYIDYISNVRKAGETFFRPGVPLVTCVQNADAMKALKINCEDKHIPFFLSEHFHLKYIQYDTGMEAKYSYMNLALAITASEIFQFYKINGMNAPFPKRSNFRRTILHGAYYNVYPFPEKLPLIKNIDFGYYYTKKIVIRNIHLYLDTGSSYNASCSTVNWYYSQVPDKAAKLCLFSTKPTNDLLRIMLPISMVDFECIYVADYNEDGPSYQNLVDIEVNDRYDTIHDTNWVETTFQVIYNIFSLPEYDARRAASVNFTRDNLSRFEVIVDKIYHILGWIGRVSRNFPNKEYHILCCGSKRLLDDIYIQKFSLE